MSTADADAYPGLLLALRAGSVVSCRRGWDVPSTTQQLESLVSCGLDPMTLWPPARRLDTAPRSYFTHLLAMDYCFWTDQTSSISPDFVWKTFPNQATTTWLCLSMDLSVVEESPEVTYCPRAGTSFVSFHCVLAHSSWCSLFRCRMMRGWIKFRLE